MTCEFWNQIVLLGSENPLIFQLIGVENVPRQLLRPTVTGLGLAICPIDFKLEQTEYEYETSANWSWRLHVILYLTRPALYPGLRELTGSILYFENKAAWF